MNEKPQSWAHDFETLKNCTVLCTKNIKDKTMLEFVIHKLRNDFIALVKFLLKGRARKDWHISFNGIEFDSQIVEFIIQQRYNLVKLGPDAIAREIYKEAQRLIESQSHEKPWSNTIPLEKLSHKQLDVFKMNNWDNVAKSSSLKWIQYAIDWHDVREMPIPHTAEITKMEQINEIISYCWNDVDSTEKILKLSSKEISMRNALSKKYNLPCWSYSDIKIGSELLLKLYREKLGQPFSGRKRTNRKQIKFKDILFSYLKFESPDFHTFYEKMKVTVIRETKGELKNIVKYGKYKFHLGTGGLHQSLKGIFEADEEHYIQDIDVGSMYTSVGCLNCTYPAHLGPVFFEVFKEDIVDVRLAEKAKGKDGDEAIVKGFKLAGNAAVGKSNSKYSWMYDPQYFVGITINGQLSILMLLEKLLMGLTNPVILQSNTDGITVKVKRSERELLQKLCKEWEEETKLQLEYAEYQKMFLWDVNNYIAVYTDEKKKPKCKGRFEWREHETYSPDILHKNKSHLIIPKAIYHYFLENIPPERYLQENRNIFDYCAGIKAKGGWEYRSICNNQGNITEQKLQKIVRYYVSNKGCKIMKYCISKDRKHPSYGKISQVEAQSSANWLQTVFNKYEKLSWEQYDVDDRYYLEKIYAEIANIDPPPTAKALTLGVELELEETGEKKVRTIKKRVKDIDVDQGPTLFD